MFTRSEEVLNKIEHCFRLGDGLGFIQIFKSILKEKIILDFQKIPNLRKKIGVLIIRALESSIPTAEFSLFFKILDIANKFELLKEIENEEDKLNQDSSIISDLLMLENLHDLFGNFNTDFISFINFDLPKNVLNLILNITPNFISALNETERIQSIRAYIENNSYLYGFRVRKVGMFDNYIKKYQKNREYYEKGYYSLRVRGEPSIISSNFFFEYLDSIQEIHIIREDVFDEIIKKYKTEKNILGYPCVSMVISGGIGPQGKGFVYLTPKNEVIEICSDARQNKAYILEFKKFLKSIFLSKLEERLEDWDISENLIKETIKFLDSVIEVEFVSLSQIDRISDKIEAYLENKLKKFQITEEFIIFLKNSIYNILVPIKIEDQFKTRMDLIIDNKLSPTDISKLVSLGTVSHFDILCQRQFFLNMIDNALAIYLKEG